MTTVLVSLDDYVDLTELIVRLKVRSTRGLARIVRELPDDAVRTDGNRTLIHLASFLAAAIS